MIIICRVSGRFLHAEVLRGGLGPLLSTVYCVLPVCVYKDESEANREDSDPGSLMSCLIKKKHYDDMNEKCRAGIEHHQLVCTIHRACSL